jgi:hypothetical protein
MVMGLRQERCNHAGSDILFYTKVDPSIRINFANTVQLNDYLFVSVLKELNSKSHSFIATFNHSPCPPTYT